VALLVGVALAEPAVSVQIRVAASKGRIIPLAKGGGFQRTFRFTATPAESNHWIMQVLAVRGSVLDARGGSVRVHLDVIEYYRVGSSGRAIQDDSHYSQYRDHGGGDLAIRSTLTYGTLRSLKRGDTILGKSFILRSARDANSDFVTMRTRKGHVIPSEYGKRVAFEQDHDSVPVDYGYRVRWNSESRARPSGAIEIGTWQMQSPRQTGPTVAVVRPRPIPALR